MKYLGVTLLFCGVTVAFLAALHVAFGWMNAASDYSLVTGFLTVGVAVFAYVYLAKIYAQTISRWICADYPEVTQKEAVNDDPKVGTKPVGGVDPSLN